MELGSLIGIIIAVVALLGTLLIQVQFVIPDLMFFVNAAGILIVLGGTFASGMISVPFGTFKAAMRAGKLVFKPPKLDPAAAVKQIGELALLARKEGVLSLEDAVSSLDDEFLKKGIRLVADGVDQDLVRDVMDTELSYIEERHVGVASTYDLMGAFAPAWGMAATMIGLIVMLQNMDPETLGADMALAIITTFYGVLVANAWAIPFATKLRLVNKEEMLLKSVQIEGMLSIQAGDNPRIIEEKLKAFLAPTMRGAEDSSGAEDA